jgi:hypothetical protein
LASNQVRIELRHADYPETALRLAIAEQDGLLVACAEEPGWLCRLTPAEVWTLDQAITGMYKLAGIDLVRAPARPLPERNGAVANEPFDGHRGGLPAPGSNGAAEADGGVLAFRKLALPWTQWVDWWRRDRGGEPVPPPLAVLPASLRSEPGASATG